MHIDEIKAWEAQKEEVAKMSFNDVVASKMREEREKPSMVDVFTAMTIDRRENEESLMDAFTAMTIKRREEDKATPSFMDLIHAIAKEEREQPSMMDAFTAMTIERREQEAQQPKSGFFDFMVNMAKAEAAKPKSFMAATHNAIAAKREQPSMVDAFTAMTLESRLAKNEPKKLFEKGLPHAMAMMAVKQHEASQTAIHQKEITFLNDVLHPDSVYEPFTFTATKAAYKYFSN